MPSNILESFVDYITGSQDIEESTLREHQRMEEEYRIMRRRAEDQQEQARILEERACHFDLLDLGYKYHKNLQKSLSPNLTKTNNKIVAEAIIALDNSVDITETALKEIIKAVSSSLKGYKADATTP